MSQTTILAGFLKVIGQSFSAVVQRLLGHPPAVPSPFPRIMASNLLYDASSGILAIDLNLPDLYFISVQDTNSMAPFLDAGSIGCMTKAFTLDKLHTGDGIMFWVGRGTVLHQLAFIGYDKKGWFGLTRGSNHFWPDMGVVRPKDVISRLVAVIHG